MEMHQVRYFLAVARERNFTRAAEACNVTQPSLTRAIQKLEEEFGGALFRRERALTHLTELGKMMHPHLERSFEAAQQARALARQVERAELAPLSLGIADDVGLDGLGELLRALDGAFRGFEVTLTCGPAEQLLEAGLAGELDAWIADVSEETPDRVDRWELMQEGHCLLAASSAGLSGTISAEALKALPRIARDCAAERALESAMGGLPAPRHRAGSAAASALLAAAGMGVALVPRGLPWPAGTVALELEPGVAAPTRLVSLAAIAGRRRSAAADAFVKSARARGWGPPLS